VVFDDVARSDGNPASNAESTADFLNRVAGIYWQRIRDLIEQWLTRFCSDGQPDIRARLRSSDNRLFRAAFWELYCHETLLRLGYLVECHPDVGTGSRRPDFLGRRDGSELLLEATVAADPDDQVARERRVAQVYDSLNRLDSPNHFLFVEVHRAGPASPSVARQRPQIERWLATLDPDALGQQMAADTSYLISEQTPRFVWDDEGWLVTFMAIPKRPEKRGQAGVRPVGMQGPGEAYMLDDRGKIRRAAVDKAGAYGRPDRPYVVAVAAASFTTDDIDVTDALFGSEQVTFIADPDGGEPTVTPSRARDGVFIGANGPQYTRVSGVLAATNLEPWTVARSVPTLWHHPTAEHPVALDRSPWRQAVVEAETDQLKFLEPTITPAEFFDLPTNWPGPEEPFDD